MLEIPLVLIIYILIFVPIKTILVVIASTIAKTFHSIVQSTGFSTIVFITLTLEIAKR